ncbi:hypothetical protein K439DRAFT_1629831 [Ramaria rubella]|nr:hypothetical protein K439DRAFT_1629831 [Ramaria rubella]
MRPPPPMTHWKMFLFSPFIVRSSARKKSPKFGMTINDSSRIVPARMILLATYTNRADGTRASLSFDATPQRSAIQTLIDVRTCF